MCFTEPKRCNINNNLFGELKEKAPRFMKVTQINQITHGTKTPPNAGKANGLY